MSTATLFDDCPDFGLAPRQAELLAMLWPRRGIAGAHLPGVEIANAMRMRSGVARLIAETNKRLLRHGWQVLGFQGPGGGYRLMRIAWY